MPDNDKKMMTFGLDYADTYSRDPELFNAFINQALERGHQVVCVTGMKDEGDFIATEMKETVGQRIPIIFTDGMAKSKAAERFGFRVSVWIDDRPEGIYRDSKSGFSQVLQVTIHRPPSR